MMLTLPQPRSSHPRHTHVCSQPKKKTAAIKLKFGYEGGVPRVSGYNANAPQKNQNNLVNISAGLPRGITAEKTEKERQLPMFSVTEIIESRNSMMHIWNLT